MAVDDENVATYLRDVRNLKWLQGSEVHDVLTASREGDEAARRCAVEGHLELTALLALQLAPEWLLPLDAIQEANLVLTQLIDDPSVPIPASVLTARLVEHFDKLERHRNSEP